MTAALPILQTDVPVMHSNSVSSHSVRSSSISPEVLRCRRSMEDLLRPLEEIAASSVNLISNHGASFELAGERYELPRYLFVGPQGGGEPIRLGIFATVHGDEPEGAHALVQLVRALERNPDIAQGYCLFLYPVCNPTGYEDGTRFSRRGRDLNREFWNHSQEPEVTLLQSELWTHAFHGIISLHSDDTSHGMYGFVSGATLSKNLLEPALKSASGVLPTNLNEVIDGFLADQGVIKQGYQGILRAPPGTRSKPFEIVLETPQAAPQYLQHQALSMAIQSILTEYRSFISYAANL